MTRWILLVALILWAAPGWATTYYVRTDGSNSNTGTTDSAGGAFLTIQKGVTVAVAGDTVKVHSGNYTETVTCSTSGTVGNPITIQAYGSAGAFEAVKVNYTSTLSSFIISPNKSYITIRGFELDGSSASTTVSNFNVRIFEGSSNIILEYNNIHGGGINIMGAHSGGHPGATGSNNITIQYNSIHDNRSVNAVDGASNHNIYSDTGTNWIIQGNSIYNATGYNIHLYPETINSTIVNNIIYNPAMNDGGNGSAGILLSAYGHTVANNTVFGGSSGSAMGIRVQYNSSAGSLGSGDVIENNAIYNTGAYGLYIGSGATGLTARNNVINGASTTISNNAGAGATLSNNLTTNPSFVNATTIPYDFHLNAGSPAIGTGYDLTGIVTTDYYSTLRSAPYDIGAVKYTVIGGGGGGGSNNFTQVATDTFNRAAEDPLNASNWVRNSGVGHQFVVPSANPTVAQPKIFDSGDAAATWIGTGTFTADQYCQVVLGPVATTGGDNTIGYGCSVRGSTSAGTKTEYALVASHSGWELRRDVAGTYLSLAKSTTTTFNQGDSMTLWVYGTSPPTFGMQKGTTDIDLTGATRCGSCGASGAITDGNASSISTGAPGIFYSSTETGGTDHGIDTWFGGNYLNGADVTAPSVPTGLTVTANLPNQLLVSWTASTDNVAVTNYTVQACTLHSCTNFATLATPTGVSYTYTGLANNTVYAVQVRANDAAGNSSAYATAVEATTLPSTQVPVISNPIPTGSAVVDASPITISVNTDIPAVCKYNTRTEGTAAYASLAHTMTANALVNSASVTPDQHTSNSGVNHFYIACDNAASTGHASATTDMTFTMIAPGDATKPSTITNLTSTALDAVRMQLSWTAATDNTAVTGYNIYCSTGIGTPIVTFNTDPITATPILVAGAVSTSAVLTLTLGTVYNCVADAFDAAGNIALDSNVAVSQTFSALSAPTNVHLVGAPSNNIIELVWDPSTDVSAVGYHIYQSTVSGSLGSLVGTNTQATAAATHSSITTFRTVIGAAGTYYYTIKSINAVGQEGAASAQLAVVRTGSVARTLRIP